ncbi:hypothetical protein [Halomicrococcus gelatinilyticus]|uniref:hypothetical protein n=1 Tax=Halomicrococcus gelatinilyticus TaxID=1702103 RepID=UPI002E0E62DD
MLKRLNPILPYTGVSPEKNDGTGKEYNMDCHNSDTIEVQVEPDLLIDPNSLVSGIPPVQPEKYSVDDEYEICMRSVLSEIMRAANERDEAEIANTAQHLISLTAEYFDENE